MSQHVVYGESNLGVYQKRINELYAYQDSKKVKKGDFEAFKFVFENLKKNEAESIDGKIYANFVYQFINLNANALIPFTFAEAQTLNKLLLKKNCIKSLFRTYSMLGADDVDFKGNGFSDGEILLIKRLCNRELISTQSDAIDAIVDVAIKVDSRFKKSANKKEIDIKESIFDFLHQIEFVDHVEVTSKDCASDSEENELISKKLEALKKSLSEHAARKAKAAAASSKLETQSQRVLYPYLAVAVFVLYLAYRFFAPRPLFRR